MRETSIETLKRLERTIAKQAAELSALRSAIADVLEMATGFDDPHDFRECAVERLRLASLPPAGGGE